MRKRHIHNRRGRENACHPDERLAEVRYPDEKSVALSYDVLGFLDVIEAGVKAVWRNQDDVTKVIVQISENVNPATCDEPDRLVSFLKFLLENETIKKEIKQAFGDYAVENLYAIVY